MRPPVSPPMKRLVLVKTIMPASDWIVCVLPPDLQQDVAVEDVRAREILNGATVLFRQVTMTGR